MLQKYGEDINWIHLVEGRVRFREASVNIVMNIELHKSRVVFNSQATIRLKKKTLQSVEFLTVSTELVRYLML
jgi:hypothetical protein